ncbi:MAG: ZIP family metal transporter, partial [Candidatus Melainabacteria bacterium]|nr:ZIP family metal transporter [Candidatus Melainabacteria bacterium]
MDTVTNISSHLALGAVAGLTIFLGLPIARWKRASERLRGMLALVSAGVLIFLIIEVGYHAIEILESAAKSSSTAVLPQFCIFILGLVLGLIGLASLEERRSLKHTEGADPIHIASMIALGIGFHNFAEGLAIGQSFTGGALSLGTVLVIGFALHNATEGFGIAAPLVGQDVSWSKLFMLGLIGGGPTAIGAVVGGLWVNPTVELLFLSLAVGSLIYVTRELLRLKFTSLTVTSAMTALLVGLVLGVTTEIFVEVAMVNNSSNQARSKSKS